ncbi:hypothetical protein AXA88_19590 [Salmonella enterica]|nr:hypothetical protein [Salmonella enterica]ECY7602810.1 hypothetical protein [Salmonella enterica subsp. enterica serovar Muenchen]EDA1490784.1 hypothetical protein [Salmonella enterica subsp. enterica serovar Coeln]EAX3608077.1 hypothetical protein [Salmonella enterica]EDA5877446.1 hypothetical protein [Salmonella enterica subsp. enterica serovar Coeln]
MTCFITSANAAAVCGGYTLERGSDGMTLINGEEVTSQKIQFIGKEKNWDESILRMGLMPASDGNNYGFEFIKHNGKARLNVELIFADMDAPRIIGSFPCHRVK